MLLATIEYFRRNEFEEVMAETALKLTLGGCSLRFNGNGPV